MILHMKELLKIMLFKGKEYTNGMMVEFIMENGYKIKCMEKEYSLGQMGKDMKVIT